MSDSDASGEKDQEPRRASRPVTAAARRERRASVRPAGKASAREADKARPAATAGSATDTAETAKKGRATPRRDRREKRASLLARLVRFIREVWAELRKVIWPTRKELLTYTTIVIAFVTVMTTIVGVLDYGFGKAILWAFGGK